MAEEYINLASLVDDMANRSYDPRMWPLGENNTELDLATCRILWDFFVDVVREQPRVTAATLPGDELRRTRNKVAEIRRRLGCKLEDAHTGENWCEEQRKHAEEIGDQYKAGYWEGRKAAKKELAYILDGILHEDIWEAFE